MKMIYIGDCRTILEQDDSPFQDATEMAQIVENGVKIKRGIYASLSLGVAWKYNSKNDVHYFYKIL